MKIFKIRKSLVRNEPFFPRLNIILHSPSNAKKLATNKSDYSRSKKFPHQLAKKPIVKGYKILGVGTTYVLEPSRAAL